MLLISCASNRQFRTALDDPGAPRSIELREEATIATVHFPSGLYSLAAGDHGGYYYRAPRSLMKHSFAGSVPHDGGIFLRKGNRKKLRGYIVWAGGVTKIGNLSGAPYAFRR